jgi:predicted ATPase
MAREIKMSNIEEMEKHIGNLTKMIMRYEFIRLKLNREIPLLDLIDIIRDFMRMSIDELKEIKETIKENNNANK